MFKVIFSKNDLNAPEVNLEPQYVGQLVLSSHISSSSNLSCTGIEYSANEKKVVVRSAIGNPLPLFWGWRENDLVIADNAAAALEAIKRSSKVELQDIDKVAQLESILFDGPLADRTLFSQVKKVQMAEELVFDLASKSFTRRWLWLPKIQIHSYWSYDDASAQAKDRILTLREKLEESSRGVVLPITGGLDSRMLAALVCGKSSLPTYSYTFQRGWSFESWCAKKVARQLGAEHSIFNLGFECYKTVARDVVRRSGGMVTGMHTHGIYCCERLLSEYQKKLPRMFGFYGDPITGAMTETKEQGLASSSAEAIYKKYINSLYSDQITKYRDDIVADLQMTAEAFNLSESPAHCFHEFWKIQQRQNNLITHLFHYHRSLHGVRVLEPFIDQEFIEFFLGLPLELRINRFLFKDVCAKIFPEIFKLPSMHYPEKSLFARLEFLCEKLEDVANRISPRQEILLSPFRYEHHDKNLQNYLQKDIQRGVEFMSELYCCPAVNIEYPLWRHSSSAKEHYRLAAFGYLID